jgi:hypothetical protein
MRELCRLRQPFLMPCKLTKGIKRALIEHADGTRPMISRYAMRNALEDEASFTLVIFPKVGGENETDPCKRYIPFATNLPSDKILWNIRRLPKDYRLSGGSSLVMST